jgi:hypothetical protein
LLVEHEPRLYLRVRDILALAADYRADDAETQAFYQTVQMGSLPNGGGSWPKPTG